MTNRVPLLLLTAVAAAMAACSSVPPTNAALEQVRQRHAAMQRDARVGRLAPEELQRARTSLGTAERAQAAGEPRPDVDHLAYLANQHLTIAQDAASVRESQAMIDGAAAESDRLRLALRTQEADVAKARLQASERDNARQGADLAQADRQARADQTRLAQAERDAQAGQERLARRDAQVDDLEQQLQELNARRTPRGIVVTLGDLQFDTGQAQLRPDGARGMMRLAEFMKRHPQRQAAIDGYTDDVGSESANLALSDRRAQAVQAALVDLGVPAARLHAQGHGESAPVASNATAGGRQSNRRVEVVFAGDAGGR